MMLAGSAEAQVSPGPLARAHAAYDGGTQCFQCHARSGGSMDSRCLACHTEIAALREARRGLHARTGDRACASCHPDHGGRDFKLIAFDGGSPEKFDHAKAGLPLLGKHAELKCQDCHSPRLQRDPLLTGKRRVKDAAHSWVGLQRECRSCHEDVHRGQLGKECQSCHGEKAWKPAPGFDHAKSRYPLTGKHTKVECMACHANAAVSRELDAKGNRLAQWKPLPFSQCSSCHRDPHAGRFGAECTKCHSTDGFSDIDTRHFDHERTRYPLRGEHASVACESCHRGTQGQLDKPAFGRCDDCHRDAHAGKATLAGQAVDCASCHDVRGFGRSILPLAAHQQSAYPLTGAHLEAACEGCHRKAPASAAATAALGPARIELRPAHARCVDCHQDPHGGRFAPKGPRGRAEDCMACHSDAHFTPSEFGPDAHQHARFVLDGAHRAVPCAQCHAEMTAATQSGPSAKPSRDAASARRLTFEDSRRACADCHKDPHGGQFAEKKAGACDRCHGAESFAPASHFRHDRDSDFKLEGAHVKAACASCHTTARDASGAPNVIYRPLSTRCESCHTDTAPGGGARPNEKRRSMRMLSSTCEVDHGSHAS